MKWEMISAQKTRESTTCERKFDCWEKGRDIDGKCGEGVCMHNIWLLI